MKGGKTHCHGCIDVAWASFWGKAGAGNRVLSYAKQLRCIWGGKAYVPYRDMCMYINVYTYTIYTHVVDTSQRRKIEMLETRRKNKNSETASL